MLTVILLNVKVLNAFMMNVYMLNDFMLVVMLNVKECRIADDFNLVSLKTKRPQFCKLGKSRFKLELKKIVGLFISWLSKLIG
jgi:hypothetical protein